MAEKIMPMSNYHIIPEVISRLITLQPTSILDIGTGWGTFGFLSREYSDIRWNRFKKEEWKVRIDGIEICEKYITDVHKLVYNNIYIGNCCNILKTLQQYEMILFIDVIEHMPHEVGLAMIEEIKKHCMHAIITTPLAFKRQVVDYNKYEKHITTFSIDELLKYGEVTELDHKINLLEICENTNI
jgi:2-polyprenyl-3-methyl-5-hydroxy-6-metoxy-1,4-benzoquinol methylase